MTHSKRLPRVSILMNCLNCDRYLREAIDSVYAQTYDSWEIIFWDNASSDGSAAIANAYDQRLRYFRGDKTIPLGAARNAAIQQARGEFIAFLDCDDSWLPDKLEKQLPAFEDKSIGLVYSDAYYFNDHGRGSRLYESRKAYTGKCFRALLIDYSLSLQTVVVRREALDDLNEIFDERFYVIEDYDLFLRIAHDWGLYYVEQPLANYRVHQDSWTYKKLYLFAHETRIMLDKFCAIYPGFCDDYRNELLICEDQFVFIEARYAWREHGGAGARSCLKRLHGRTMKSAAWYLASFLPFWFVEKMYSRLTGRISVG